MESLKLQGYLDKIRGRKVEKPNAKTRTAELVEPFLPCIAWDDSTFFSDMQGFWVAVYRYKKSHTDEQLLSLMGWVKDKSLHPRAVIKTLRK